MAFNETLAQRIRDALKAHRGVSERKMFGGLAFMLNGNMCCGILGDELMVRVGDAGYENALKRPHVRPMDFTGRPMRGMIFVSTAGLQTRPALESWLAPAVSHAQSLGPKPGK